MTAAVLAAPGRFELREVDMPQPGPRQVRVRLEGCGVCGSNMAAWEGKPWFEYPFAPGAPGHEAWGRIDALGAEAVGFDPGERVGILSYNAFAEYDLAETNALVRLPDGLDPFPAEPLACAMNVFRRTQIGPGDTVAIIGIGFLGTLLTRLAALSEARTVALGRRRFALGVAERFGANLAVELGGDHAEALEAVRKFTGGGLCDIVIEATGKQEPLTLAGELTRERGRLVVAGYHQDGPRQVDMQLWNWRGLDVINAHERSPAVYLDGMREAVNVVEAGLLDPTSLYTHRLPLERIDEAFRLCAERPEGFLKALVQIG